MRLHGVELTYLSTGTTLPLGVSRRMSLTNLFVSPREYPQKERLSEPHVQYERLRE
jgi:hypothetical protein